MVISEQDQVAEKFHYNEEDDSDTEECDSDESREDPTFDVVEKTRSSFSRLSIKKTSKSGNIKETEEGNEEVPDILEMILPELDEEDQKSFEVVQKIIEVGQVEKLKVDQCKFYLRKYGLRLTGNKDILIGRIKEHLDILGGGGENKYPLSTFVLNCKGDACTGDVVMFEQIVYEMFNIASRSASGPPCGTRIVAGRIVKESYGAAKQQHTFTIEVLWSKGEKPLPPLHPLLIKGRNLYRLKTMRQRWENEGKRQKIISEKHGRGSLARSNREARIQEKEMRKANRASRMEVQNRKQKETKVQSFQSLSIGSEKLGSQPQEQQKECWYSETSKENTSIPLETLHRQPASMPSERIHQRQHSTSMPSRCPFQSQNHEQSLKSIPSQGPFQRQGHQEETNCNPLRRIPFKRPLTSMNCSINAKQSMNSNPLRNPFQMQGREQSMNSNPVRNSLERQAHKENMNFSPIKGPFQRHDHRQRQLCRFYAQGRCYYGDHCKYLHDYRENHNYGQRKGGKVPI